MSPAYKLGGFSVLSVFLATLVTTITGTSVSALGSSQDTVSRDVSVAQQEIPLEIEPVCSDALTSTAYWKVTNKNQSAVTVQWTNTYNNASGAHSATPATQASAGTSQMRTSYDAADANNRTEFVYQNERTSTNATKAACQPIVTPPVEQCIDGSIQQNLVVTFLSDTKASVTTKDGKLLCNDVTVFFSSYTMPSNYDGRGFENNPTAYPQYIRSSMSATLKAGTTGSTVLVVDAHNPCDNTQIDVYYGPEIRTVGPNGHGTQNILSKIITKSQNCDNGNGGATPSPTAPSKPRPSTPVKPQSSEDAVNDVPQEQVTELPKELPETGSDSNPAFMLIGILMALMTYAVLNRVAINASSKN